VAALEPSHARTQHLAAVGGLLAALTSAEPAGTQASASGSNNVAVGMMTGGTINYGISAERVQALLNAQGTQRDEFVRKLVADRLIEAGDAALTDGRSGRRKGGWWRCRRI
jgi:hypothetical protein